MHRKPTSPLSGRLCIGYLLRAISAFLYGVHYSTSPVLNITIPVLLLGPRQPETSRSGRRHGCVVLADQRREKDSTVRPYL